MEVHIDPYPRIRGVNAGRSGAPGGAPGGGDTDLVEVLLLVPGRGGKMYRDAER